MRCCIQEILVKDCSALPCCGFSMSTMSLDRSFCGQTSPSLTVPLQFTGPIHLTITFTLILHVLSPWSSNWTSTFRIPITLLAYYSNILSWEVLPKFLCTSSPPSPSFVTRLSSLVYRSPTLKAFFWMRPPFFLDSRLHRDLLLLSSAWFSFRAMIICFKFLCTFAPFQVNRGERTESQMTTPENSTMVETGVNLGFM